MVRVAPEAMHAMQPTKMIGHSEPIIDSDLIKIHHRLDEVGFPCAKMNVNTLRIQKPCLLTWLSPLVTLTPSEQVSLTA